MKEDAKEILSIPTSLSSRNDSFCWHFTKYGEYTVSSGYKVYAALDSTVSPSGSQDNGSCWDRIWALEVPSKSKSSFGGLAIIGFLRRLKEEDLRVLYVVFWRIWSLRNLLVHGGGASVVEEILPWSTDFLEG
ncbi:hypothetical protein EZV62_005271 [Acer yangbiense]|uniref:Uncharacterized protein n=1 Tax=Acer yangbiense TaxID=1000413 RepID=A0A5C7IPD1_9ROSI|nr:hypothetical protein EZV62_005271 [Acer yangbiense]